MTQLLEMSCGGRRRSAARQDRQNMINSFMRVMVYTRGTLVSCGPARQVPWEVGGPFENLDKRLSPIAARRLSGSMRELNILSVRNGRNF